MERRQFLKTAGKGGLGLLLTASFSHCANTPEKDRKPNVVFILVDDLGWKDVGFMGSEYYQTPVIDRLAGQGMYFTDAYSNAPNCAPTRACLLSGQYGPRHGVYTVGSPERGDTRLRKLIPTPNKTTLDPDIITLAEALKPAGYVSASIGKWHLGNDPDLGPVSQGFDLNVAGDSHGHPPAGYFSPYHLPKLEDAPQGEYLTDRLTNEALKFIEQNRDRPFFLYLSHYAVHKPVQAPESLVEQYRKKPGSQGQNNPEYAAMIESVDTNIGRILDTLEELQLVENTIVIFFSDNGGHGNETSMEPLRGSKGMIYEGGIRVPLIVRWPGQVSPGSVCHVPIIGLDFYPTILEMAGVNPPDQVLDGESLIPLLRGGQQLDRSAIFWHFPAYLEPYNTEQWPWRITPCSAVRQGDWKLIEFYEYETLELYHLSEDVGEQHNLAEERPEKTQELLRVLRDWKEKVEAPVPNQLNPEYDPVSVPRPVS